jgi:hypothetical protein
MRELSEIQKEYHTLAWSTLKRAKDLSKNRRVARAQDVLTEALSLTNFLPIWFTDEDLEKEFEDLHRELYRNV